MFFCTHVDRTHATVDLFSDDTCATDDPTKQCKALHPRGLKPARSPANTFLTSHPGTESFALMPSDPILPSLAVLWSRWDATPHRAYSCTPPSITMQ